MLKNFFVLPVGILLFFCCKNPEPAGAITIDANKYPCTTSSKITAIYKENVYDLEGYADEGGGDPFNLFDENAYVDPRSENKSAPGFLPVTNPQPTQHQAIYFPKNKGSRIVTDLRVSYKLSDIYIYDRSNSNDSVWIYIGNMQHWKLKAAFETRSDPGLWGWRKFSVDDSSQYVMIRFSSYETKITEMVMYGCPYGTIPAAPGHIDTSSNPKKMMKEFLGANYFNETAPEWLKPFHFSRIYTFAGDFDDATVDAYPNIKFNLQHFGRLDASTKKYTYFMEDNSRQNSGITWFSIRGVPMWMDKKGFTDKDRPVTLPGMDPTNPLSYKRHANLMWTMAAFFGSTKTDSNMLSLSHPAYRQGGTGIMTLYENGNEEDAWWVGDKYSSPASYFAQSSADYDGNEGMLGEKTGIKNADQNSRLLMSGIIGLDTNRIKVYKFLCNTLRHDKAFLWTGGIQYHYYSTDGKKGLSPEEDSLRWKLSKVSAFTHRLQPGVDCILGENGYDKDQAGRQSTPVLPGFSNSQSQGIFILRAINATAFAGFDSYVLYWLKDTDQEDDQRVYLTSGVIRQMPDGSVHPYPGWYYISAFVNRLANYSADAIISEKGNVWIYKYRNQLSPDSVAYFIYCPTHNGTKVDGYALKLNKPAGANALEVSLSDHSVSGDSITRRIISGAVNISVEEKPKIILVKELR